MTDATQAGRDPQLPPPADDLAPGGAGMEPMLAAGAAGVEALAREAVRRLCLPEAGASVPADRLVAALAAVLAGGEGVSLRDRIRAADALARLGPSAAAAVPTLAAALPEARGTEGRYGSSSATTPSLARAVIGALGAVGPAHEAVVVPILTGCLERWDWAFEALARIGPTGAAALAERLQVGELSVSAPRPATPTSNRSDFFDHEGDTAAGFAQYSHDWVSIWAAGAVAETAFDHPGVDRLVRACIGPDKFTRDKAFRAMRRLPPGHSRVPEAVGHLVPSLVPDVFGFDHQDAAKALARLGPAAVGGLETVVGEPMVGVRVWAAEALCGTGAAEALPALRRLAGDPSPRVRAPAAEGLLRLGRVAEAGPILTAVLACDHERAGRRALDALQEMPVEAAGPFVDAVRFRAFAGPDGIGRRVAALSRLHEWGLFDERAAAALVDAVTRGEYNETFQGLDDAVSLAARAADVLSAGVRRQIVEALMARGGDILPMQVRSRVRAIVRLSGPGVAGVTVERLMLRLRPSDNNGFKTAEEPVRLLGRLGRTAAAALPSLKQMSRQDASARVRIAAAGARLRIGGPAEEPLLILLWWAASPCADARREALDELAELNPPPAEALGVARRMLDERVLPVAEAACRLLGAMGPAAAAAVPALAARLADPGGDTDVRRECAAALGAIGPGAAGAQVAAGFASALSSPLWRLRLAAVEGLAALGPEFTASHDLLRVQLDRIAATEPVARIRRALAQGRPAGH